MKIQEKKTIVIVVEKILDFNKQVKGLPSDHTHIKILTSKQMLQRLPIALAQMKVGNASQNLANEIRQIIYSMYKITRTT